MKEPLISHNHNLVCAATQSPFIKVLIFTILLTCVFTTKLFGKASNVDDLALETAVGPSILPIVLGSLATGTCGSIISGQPPCSLSCPENQGYDLECKWTPLCGQPHAGVCPSNAIQRFSRECAQSSKQLEQVECCTCDKVLNLRGGFGRFYTPLLSRLTKRSVSSKMKDQSSNLPSDLDKWKKGGIVRLRNQDRKEDDGLRGVISEVGTLGCTVRLMNEGNMSRFFPWEQLELLIFDTKTLDYD